MKRLIQLAVVLLAITNAPQASAQNCKNPETQLAMNTCAAKDLDREDARLNKNYRELQAKLDADRRTALRDVQVAWLKFRDLQCDFQAAQYEGGSIYPMVRAACLTDMTKQRNKDLKYLLDEAAL